MSGAANHIVISGIGPGDGLQIHEPFIPTAEKVRLVDAGLKRGRVVGTANA